MSGSLGDLVDLAVQLQRDADQPQAASHQRDRLLLAQCGELPAHPRQRLRVWLEWMRGAGESLPGDRVNAGYRLLIMLLALLGLLAGMGVASLVFRYDGTRPVNVVHVLAVLVVAQLALLLLLGAVMLPAAWLRRVPGALAVQETLAAFSPGQTIRLLRRRLPAGIRELTARAGQAVSWHRGPFEAVWKWAAITAAQVFAVAFNLAALATGFYLVTFSDLAFAWSTTLQPEVERVHRLTGMLAAPWARFVPAAVPSPELIRNTLYYRHQPLERSDRPTRWGGWWPFLMAALVTYGAFPRVVLLTWSAVRLRRHLNHALAESPGARLVLERLDANWVSTQATAEEPKPIEGAELPDVGTADPLPGKRRFCLVNWGGLPVPDADVRRQFARRWRGEIVAVHHAGGRVSVAADEETIRALGRESGDGATVVFVKGWEPPLLEFMDFLQALRTACGGDHWIIVLPVGLNPDAQLAPSPGVNLEVWQRKVRAIGDPAIQVRAWPESQGAPP